jgi:hypothetical protein
MNLKRESCAPDRAEEAAWPKLIPLEMVLEFVYENRTD